MTCTDAVFAASAAVCTVSAVAAVSRKNPVYAVVFMLPFFLGLTTIFVLLEAPFLAAVQMIVYGGAILVLFLFVLMLINLRPEELREDFAPWPWGLAAFAAALLAGVLFVFSRAGAGAGQSEAFRSAPGFEFGSAASLGGPLFKQFLVPFELVSVLIVAAIFGAVLLSKKRV
ncbi:MAG: NADH-quinone oxidoreductase subunit J [Planctomycetota bacterium]